MYDLSQLCDTSEPGDEFNDSPFEILSNKCDYYEPCEINKILTNDHNNMSIFCMNCQGLRAHWDSFRNLVWEMCADNNALDIIGITELFSMNMGECALDGYHPLEFKTRNDTNSSRGGIGLYIRDKHSYEYRHDLSIFIPNVFESIFIELHINKKSTIIGIIYRPNTPPKADVDIFMQTMHDLQNKLNMEGKETFIMGDMNIDLLKCTTHVKTQEYLDNIFAQGFVPLITKPTRVTEYTATLIDHIYHNKNEKPTHSGIIISDISDHFGIFSVVKNCSKVPKSNSISYRTFKETNMNAFKNSLDETDFACVLEDNNSDTVYDKFI